MSQGSAAHYARLLEGAEADVAIRAAERTPPPLVSIIEALLFASNTPLTATAAATAIRGLTEDQFQCAIDAIRGKYRRQGRPYALQSRSGGYAMALMAEHADIRDRLTGGQRRTRLTQPMLDVLAVVAYKQPVTRNEVDAIRGAESNSILRQLVRLNLIAVFDPLPAGKEPTYNTTANFLELFGLRTLDDLPQTADLQKI